MRRIKVGVKLYSQNGNVIIIRSDSIKFDCLEIGDEHIEIHLEIGTVVLQGNFFVTLSPKFRGGLWVTSFLYEAESVLNESNGMRHLSFGELPSTFWNLPKDELVGEDVFHTPEDPYMWFKSHIAHTLSKSFDISADIYFQDGQILLNIAFNCTDRSGLSWTYVLPYQDPGLNKMIRSA